MKKLLLGISILAVIGGIFFYSLVSDTLSGVWPILESKIFPPKISTSVPSFTLPEGFTVEIFAKNIGNARVLAFDPQGVLLVSLLKEGKVVAFPDENHDGVADKEIVILQNLNNPHGLAFKCATTCTLFVAETSAVKAYRYDQKTMAAVYEKTLATLPSNGGHFTRSLLLDPDEQHLLVSIGSLCNVCNESDPMRASIQSIDLASGEMKLYAKGLRNTVFMAVRPSTSEVWGSEMGRDWLGDDLPPDEINILKSGGNYGWPICYGNNMHDTIFDKNTYIRNPCMVPFETPSLIDIPAHSAPLGIAFIPEGWGSGFANNLMVSYHGSWNRSTPTGYKVVMTVLGSDGKPTGETKDFMTGFTKDRKIVGRPVALVFDTKGNLYVSDDAAGAIYRVSRK